MSSYMGVQMARNRGMVDDDRAVTVRPSSTAFFGVDSKDRYAKLSDRIANPTSPYRFTIAKNQSLLNGFFHRIALTEITLPWYIPNITDEVVDINVVTPGPVVTPIQIAGSGAFLTPSEIAANLQAEIQAIPGLNNVQVAYVDGAFAFVDAVSPVPPQFAFSRVAPVDRYQLFDFLNLGADNTVLQVDQYSGPTRCRWTEYVDVVCSQLTYNQELKDGSTSRVERDVLCRVYVEFEDDKTQPVWDSQNNEILISDEDIPGVSPFTIYRKFPMPKQILWNNAQPLGNLTFELYDDKGRILSYNDDGSANPFMQFDYKLPDWRFTLLVSEN
jgi:hypothetical protein